MGVQKKQEKIIKVKPREIFGKKLKKLRREGWIPASFYGKGVKSQSLFIFLKDFLKIYKKVKETGVVYLDLEKKMEPVLIKNPQFHPVTNNLLHVDFRKINLQEKLTTEVPVVLIGESRAVSEKGGVLIQELKSLNIEVLPENIPSEIKVDLSSLNEIDSEIKVSDLPASENYRIVTPADRVIVRVIAHKQETTTPETTLTPAETPQSAQSTQDAQEEKAN